MELKRSRTVMLTILGTSAAILLVPAIKLFKLREVVGEVSENATNYANSYAKVIDLGGGFSESELHEIAIGDAEVILTITNLLDTLHELMLSLSLLMLYVVVNLIVAFWTAFRKESPNRGDSPAI
jgi:hypothetical protein